MRMAETAFQADTFMAFVTVGLAAALLYDLATPVFRSRLAAVHVAADLILCAVTMVLCFFALALTGRNTLRLYMALALFLGALIYRAGVHRLLAGMIFFLAEKRNLRKHSEINEESNQ